MYVSVACVGAYFIYTHPALYWLFWPVVIIIIIIAAILGNFAHNFFAQGDLPSYLDDFPIMQFILNNWLKMVTVMVLLFLAFMFAKGREQ